MCDSDRTMKSLDAMDQQSPRLLMNCETMNEGYEPLGLFGLHAALEREPWTLVRVHVS